MSDAREYGVETCECGSCEFDGALMDWTQEAEGFVLLSEDAIRTWRPVTGCGECLNRLGTSEDGRAWREAMVPKSALEQAQAKAATFREAFLIRLRRALDGWTGANDRAEGDVGPLDHVMREFAIGNPGTQYLVRELAEVYKRLREYEGMMTRRGVLENIAQPMFRSADLEAFWAGYQQGLITAAQAGTRIRAAHELALLMNAEREEASDDT